MGSELGARSIQSRISALSPEQRKLFEQRLFEHGIAFARGIPLDAPTEDNGCDVAVNENLGRAAQVLGQDASSSDRGMSFSLFFFSSDGATEQEDKYNLIFECAQIGDQLGFSAVWTPERHFKPFGGLYPNPAILAASLAAKTERIHLRAGSVVLPLHNTLRVAEEWAEVDNLSGGRVGVAFSSGWHPDDFVLAPDKYAARRETLFAEIETLRRLWRGDSVILPNGQGSMIEVQVYPRPLQRELPIWVTAASRETFLTAGRIGANVLTGLIEQGVEECASNIRLYRGTLRESGFDPGSRCVTVMLHTFVGEDTLYLRKTVRRPFYSYLRSFLQMSGSRLATILAATPGSDLLGSEDEEALLDHAFEEYCRSRSLFGSPEDCQQTIDRLRAIGVDEITCLLDFGLDNNSILRGLPYLNILRQRNSAQQACGLVS